MRYILIVKLALLLLFVDAHASEKIVHFIGASYQTVDLDSPIDETHLQFRSGKETYFHQRIEIENCSDEPLKDIYPVANGKDFRDFGRVLQSLSMKGEEADFDRLFNLWKGSFLSLGQGKASPYCLLQFTGCEAEGLAKIAGFLNIPFKTVPASGHIVREFFIGDEWRLYDGCRRLVYLKLDNRSVASFDDIMEDPLLVLRTKASPADREWDIGQSALHFAQFEAFGGRACTEEELSSQQTHTQSLLSFDLYPGEKIIYHYDKTPCSEKFAVWKAMGQELGIVEQRVLLSSRSPAGGVPIIFRSPYPIQKISNDTHRKIFLPLQNRLIEIGETFELEEFPIFEMDLVPVGESDDPQGELSITCVGSPRTFPSLCKGTNTLDLYCAAGKAVASYYFDEKTEALKLPQFVVQNAETDFYFTPPAFSLNIDIPCEKIWWQISAQPDFQFIPPNLEAILPFQNTVGLDMLTETFLNAGQEYYFRVRGGKEGIWGDWSPPFSFKVIKPEPVSGIEFEKTGPGKFELRWSNADDPETTYLVFASESIDFIPSIYHDKQIDAIQDNVVAVWSPNQNLILRTAQPAISIDDRYPFYRVIAECRGAYSVPSPLIYIYDEGMSIPRNVLQTLSVSMDEERGEVLAMAERIPFPPAYNYAEQAHTYDLLIPTFRQNYSLQDLPWVIKEHPEGKKYTLNPYVQPEVWESMRPHFLPENHPIKGRLDRLFESARVTLNGTNLHKAKFKNTVPGKFSHTIVTTNSKIKNYFFKLFSDQQNIDETRHLMRRINGAKGIRDCIEAHGYQSLLKVPKKWIYPLPPEPSPPPEAYRKNFILIAEDMKIYSKGKNYARWRGKEMTEERLNAIFTVLNEVGLNDSVFAFNVPFSKDGRNAFIDTEQFNHWPVNFEKMMRYLAPERQQYLSQLLIEKGL